MDKYITSFNYNSSTVALLEKQLSRSHSILKCINSLVHACQCREICESSECQRMKRVISHIRRCKKRAVGGCQICKTLVAICCYHSRRCRETECLVPFCPGIKKKLKVHQHQQHQMQAQILRQKLTALSLDSEQPVSLATLPTDSDPSASLAALSLGSEPNVHSTPSQTP